ncbi:tRNA1(Val) (adenine(37)-N6)-methyltransferase [Rossellomorea vietnamensis]|uniref:tRNA1(Val) (Adenine(37)-N6)-methyltransferase n=1 Tax=Rossellomorea vietnamensis TaxID=218284 RepID=A0A5D4K8A4_9BACI|nr:tRNA1(Val) (adenine(37)-N6)-methyltransferase [Rossellomorea vietnamensis]TYR72930.1 tRNA1(Val) (adenine(37)-N6)-methyltransferase [Rossellomorea vietnamensis]
MVELKEDERLDYLLAENLRIIQSPSVFSFSLDAVLLANFAYVPKRKGKIIDLCSGNGVIPLMLSNRTSVPITGVEIQERLVNMAVRSIEYNQLEDQISMIHGDIKEIPAHFGNDKFDAVTCNPPYFSEGEKVKINSNEHYAIARHELLCTLEDVVKSVSTLLKQGGKASFVHRPGRGVDLLTLMRKYRIEPKRVRFVYPNKEKEANTVLVEGIKDGSPDLRVLQPLVVYNEDGSYGSEVHRMLYGQDS